MPAVFKSHWPDRIRSNASICFCAILIGILGCNPNQSASNSVEQQAASDKPNRESRLAQYKSSLSDYKLFLQPMSQLNPANGVFSYELNTPLFSDYSQKHRVIKLPQGTSVNYVPSGSLDFPVGTIIAKTFYYAADLNDDSSNRHLVETRLMEHRDTGWVGIPYLWNDEQTEAQLAIAGDNVEVNWIHSDGQPRTNIHTVPNLNDCKRCHTSETMQPIGPKASNLNRDIVRSNRNQNQLVSWKNQGMLSGLPGIEEVPRLAVWNDTETGDVNERARAYLDVNCAHCHSPTGPARNSGLHLNVNEMKPYHFGTFKTPIAAGKGTGGRLYGIVPGKPDESIMEYRMRTIKPGEIMPEFGKSLVHDEGLALIRQWINEMPSLD